MEMDSLEAQVSDLVFLLLPFLPLAEPQPHSQIREAPARPVQRTLRPSVHQQIVYEGAKCASQEGNHHRDPEVVAPSAPDRRAVA